MEEVKDAISHAMNISCIHDPIKLGSVPGIGSNTLFLIAISDFVICH